MLYADASLSNRDKLYKKRRIGIVCADMGEARDGDATEVVFENLQAESHIDDKRIPNEARCL
jgi:hypothetical protein